MLTSVLFLHMEGCHLSILCPYKHIVNSVGFALARQSQHRHSLPHPALPPLPPPPACGNQRFSLCNMQTLLSMFVLQLKILGPQYGMWGLRKYGTTLTQMDALVFWPDRLTCLAEMIETEQEQARKLAVPSAFVTFKSASASSATCVMLCHAMSCCALPMPRHVMLCHAHAMSCFAMLWLHAEVNSRARMATSDLACMSMIHEQKYMLSRSLFYCTVIQLSWPLICLSWGSSAHFLLSSTSLPWQRAMQFCSMLCCSLL